MIHCFHGNIKKGVEMNEIEYPKVVIGKLLKLGSMLQQNSYQLLKPFGINHPQFTVLFELSKTERVIQRDIVTILLLDRAHVSKIVKKLHSMELIDIESNSENSKSPWISINSNGLKLLKDCTSVFEEWNREWIGDLNVENKQEILDVLTTLQELFKDKVNK